ncbi:hypothetical protein MTR67_015569 [Solanum verrucosum]|uniref:Uncharacterized protein n=1 Tax=Solanum verrucosum TaxID=315347 RepID=A0AAF0QE92_SOLVR|nr:hypothetical protein MTR67_015569 [Solanum verrucosum]
MILWAGSVSLMDLVLDDLVHWSRLIGFKYFLKAHQGLI